MDEEREGVREGEGGRDKRRVVREREGTGGEGKEGVRWLGRRWREEERKKRGP